MKIIRKLFKSDGKLRKVEILGINVVNEFGQKQFTSNESNFGDCTHTHIDLRTHIIFIYNERYFNILHFQSIIIGFTVSIFFLISSSSSVYKPTNLLQMKQNSHLILIHAFAHMHTHMKSAHKYIYICETPPITNRVLSIVSFLIPFACCAQSYTRDIHVRVCASWLADVAHTLIRTVSKWRISFHVRMNVCVCGFFSLKCAIDF